MSENIYTNKIQIRARVLSAIVNMQKNSNDSKFIQNELSELRSISDKQTFLEVLMKEFLKDNLEMKDYTITFLMKTMIDQEEVEKTLFENLSNPKINDVFKTKIVNVLRDYGKHISYEQYLEYFENPDSIIDADTEKLLENAKVNPESQIDFLDFLTALPMPEKEMLINSLTDDYDGDSLANILIPVILSNPTAEISQIAIEAIGSSRSILAFPVLSQLLETVSDSKVKSNLQKSLSLLKLSGVKEDKTKEYYKRVLSYSPVYKCSISFPDGQGNIGLIFSRKTEIDFIRMFALVLNDTEGIVDCFGFNEITNSEFERILTKFYQKNDVVEVSAQFAKYLMVTAENLTRKFYDEVPYEYIVWKGITNDIDFEEFDIKNGLEKINLESDMLEKVYSKQYFDTWFMNVDDSNGFADVLKKIEVGKISDTAAIFKLLEENKQEIFNSNIISMLNKRLIDCAYLAKIDGRNDDAKILYSLSFDSEEKEIFLNDYLKKSVYQYFLAQKDKYESSKKATSIFVKKHEPKEIDIKFVELCIQKIEEDWG